MSVPHKRHYRVAKRDKATCHELNGEYTYDLRSLTAIGMTVYTLSILITFIIGYMIGRQD